MTTLREQFSMSAIVAVAILTLFACGGDSPERSSDPGVFHKSDAGTIRVYPGSQEVGPAKSSDDTLTQTFSVSANPADVSRFYTDSLRNWVPVEAIAPSAVAAGSYRATWEHGSDRLQLITDNPPREAGDNPKINYTLTLKS